MITFNIKINQVDQDLDKDDQDQADQVRHAIIIHDKV